jgi:hypothetical protein
MFKKLNASSYLHSSPFYNAEFEDILSKVAACYNLMLDDNLILSNDENRIRDVLLINYLKNNNIRNKIGLTKFLFDREVPEDRTIGRTDIKINTLNTFEDTAAYYIIECKRLDAQNLNGTTGLNARYILYGICRFVSQMYSNFYKTNGMIGFVVQQMDIDKNIESINTLLRDSFKQSNTKSEIHRRSFISNFEYSYCSIHDFGAGEILIYHLMFDFSKNID